MASLWLLFASLALWLRARAQTTDAVCIESYAWAYNSYGQSPCMVAAYLQKQCISTPVHIPILRQNANYGAPASNASDNSCQCSSVLYSLMSACAGCQLGNYVSWSEWSTKCRTVYMNVFPKAIPAETDVPSWAYNLNLAKGVSFNITTARLSVMDSPPQLVAKVNHISPVLYGVIGAACAFALMTLLGIGLFLWRRRLRYGLFGIGAVEPQKYSPLYETNQMGSLYVGNRPQSSEYHTNKGTSAPSSPPPIITEFRNRHPVSAPSVRSFISLPSFDSPAEEGNDYSPAMESSQGTTHGDLSKAMVVDEILGRSPVKQSPVIPVPRPETTEGTPKSPVNLR